MGNYNSKTESINDCECLICLENISNQKYVICVYCNILLHSTCEERFRRDKGYCKCPHCQKVGSIGVKEEFLVK